MSQLTNILKLCKSPTRCYLFNPAAALLHENYGAFCDRLSALQDCILRNDPAFTDETDLMMKKSVKKTTRYVVKYPENVIFMWIGSVPKSVRKSITFMDEAKAQSLYILFSYRIPLSDTKMEISLIRPLNELFLRTCDKIKEKINKFVLKQSKVVYDEESNGEFIFSAPDHPNLLLSTNEEIYQNENLVQILINNDIYRILRNPFRCTKLVLTLKPLVGCPLMPSFVLSDDLRKIQPKLHWYVGEANASLVPPTLESDLKGESKFTIKGWNYRSTSQFFCPTIEDIGNRVCVMLDMGTDTIIHCTVSDDVITKIDEPFIFENRQSTYCTKRAEAGNIRLMSYNVLADLYLDLKLKQNDLYFPYCPKDYQDCAYRYPVLLREIPGYQADIIFLQEVDERLWLRFLPEIMRNYGYNCHFKKKGLQANEGLVICYRKEQFNYFESHDMWLPDLLNTDAHPENADVVELLESSEQLKAMFISKPAVIQMLALVTGGLSGCDNILLLANTHLYFNPRYEIIRILQALLCARWIMHVAANYAKREPNLRSHVLFAGDFNSTPEGPVYELLSKGFISTKAQCVTNGQHLQKDVTFSTQSPHISSAVRLTSLADEKQFTNYTRHHRYDGEIAGFKGCLDYIWGSANVDVINVVPMPPESVIKRHVALPSKIAPSDHLPLVCDIRLR